MNKWVGYPTECIITMLEVARFYLSFIGEKGDVSHAVERHENSHLDNGSGSKPSARHCVTFA